MKTSLSTGLGSLLVSSMLGIQAGVCFCNLLFFFSDWHNHTHTHLFCHLLSHDSLLMRSCRNQRRRKCRCVPMSDRTNSSSFSKTTERSCASTASGTIPPGLSSHTHTQTHTHTLSCPSPFFLPSFIPFFLSVCVVVLRPVSEYGEKRYLVLHYFLADDTIEIREVQQPNSGRDGPGVFLRRQKLPKVQHLARQHVRARACVRVYVCARVCVRPCSCVWP